MAIRRFRLFSEWILLISLGSTRRRKWNFQSQVCSLSLPCVCLRHGGRFLIRPNAQNANETWDMRSFLSRNILYYLWWNIGLHIDDIITQSQHMQWLLIKHTFKHSIEKYLPRRCWGQSAQMCVYLIEQRHTGSNRHILNWCVMIFAVSKSSPIRMYIKIWDSISTGNCSISWEMVRDN